MADIQGFFCVDDSFNSPGTGRGTGYQSRDYSRYPMAGLKCATRFAEPLIPESEVKDRIAEKTASKTWVRDQCDRAGLRVKDQSNSSYCWIHSPTHGMECCRVMQGDPLLVLSAFYPGAQIKRGRNEGGSGIEGIEWMQSNGTCIEDMWPPMKFRGDVSGELVANAVMHKVIEYDDLDPSNHQEIWTAILSDIPVTVGVPAWGHEILITFMVWDNGPIFGIDNSWGSDWGTNGRGLLQGRMSRFDEAGAIRVVAPSDK